MRKLIARISMPQFIFLSLVAGLILRILFVQDMEYKEDEEYNFTQSQLIGTTQPWPWIGIPSGVFLVNPGMSIWVFAALAKLFGIHSPTSLATALQLFAWLGMSLILPFALKWVREEKDRTLWLWALALAMVNPFLIVYQRKLWPEGFLPFFTLLTYIGWWNRSRAWGAFLWGLVGACLGQIHMSGFFFAFALFAWTAAFKRDGGNVRQMWALWFAGSVLGALPLIPWAMMAMQQPPLPHAYASGWDEIVQFKYWAFWFTDPIGLHLGNTIGILRGPTHWDQLSDFVRYPVVGGVPTYLNGLAHVVALVTAVWIWARALAQVPARLRFYQWRGSWNLGQVSNTRFIQNAVLILCGVLMTTTGAAIRRYYLNVTFPLEFIFLATIAQPDTRTGRNLLACLWISQLVMSANFVGYVHVNHGSVTGDYGEAYCRRLPTQCR